MWIKKLKQNVTNIKPNEFQDFFDNLQNEAESSINIYMKGEKSRLTFKKRKQTIYSFIRADFIKRRRLKLIKKLKKNNNERLK